MIVLDNLIADPDNNKGYIDKLLINLGQHTFEEARTALITHAEDILKDISKRCPRTFEFTIGKTGADKDARCKSRSFDIMDAGSWNHKGINDRWKKSYLKAGYNALIVLCAVTSDHLPSLGPDAGEQIWQSSNDKTEMSEQPHDHHTASPTKCNDVHYQINGTSLGDNYGFVSDMNGKMFHGIGDRPKGVSGGDIRPQDMSVLDTNSLTCGYRSSNVVTRNITGTKTNVVNVDHSYHAVQGTMTNNVIKGQFDYTSYQRDCTPVSMTESTNEIGMNYTGNAGSNIHLTGTYPHNRRAGRDNGRWGGNIITSAYETLSDKTIGVLDMFEDNQIAKAPRQRIFDQHGYAIALEQQLIHHFTFGKQDKRILNSSLTTGGGEFSKTEAGIVYMAIRFKKLDKVVL